MFHLLLFLITVTQTIAQLPAKLLQLSKHTIKNAHARNAICNDLSPASYYFRDCPRPGEECFINPNGAQWIIIFEGGEPFDVCFDTESCSKRDATDKSSKHLPSSFPHASLDGIFSDSGEGNPNFYEQRIVYVPYCSSDMWLGAQDNYQGASIMQAVIEDLIATVFTPVSVATPYGPGPNMTSILNAQRIVIVGKAGVIRNLDHIATQFIQNSNISNVKVSGICDGCLITSTPAPFVSLDTEPCTSDPTTCPPLALLQKYASKIWNVPYDYKSLLATSLLFNTKTSLLVQHPQYDISQLQQNRLPIVGEVWPPSNLLQQKYATQFSNEIKKIMRAHHQNTGMYTFAPSCRSRTNALLSNQTHPGRISKHRSTSLLLTHNGFFCTPIQNCVLLGENASNASITFASSTSMFLNDPSHTFEPKCIDECDGIDCNAYCDVPKCGL